MPVLSERHNGTFPDSLSHGMYVPLGLILFLILGLIISRRAKKETGTPEFTTSDEKRPLYLDAEREEREPHSAPESAPTNTRQETQLHIVPRREITGENFQRPHQPPPFTPPMPLHTSFSHSHSHGPAPEFPMPTSPLFTQSPTQYALPQEFTSMEDAIAYPSGSSYPGTLSDTPSGMDIPRRRSYTKTLSTSSKPSHTVQGEIIQSDSWRRHTRVFGGGVCKACEESELRMSA
jgi:hypothetical protein